MTDNEDNNLSDNHLDSDEPSKSPKDPEVENRQEPSQKTRQLNPITKRQKRVESSVESDEKLDKAFNILSNAAASGNKGPEQNECQLFGNLVAKKIAKYSFELQSNVQQDIMNILFQADRVHLRQTSNSFGVRQSHNNNIQYQSYYYPSRNLVSSIPQQPYPYQDYSQLNNIGVNTVNLQQTPLSSPTYSTYSNTGTSVSVNDTNSALAQQTLLDMTNVDLQEL